jgi:hypothetical protein
MVSYYFLERPIIRRFAGRFPRVTPEREARHAAARASASTALAT